MWRQHRAQSHCDLKSAEAGGEQYCHEPPDDAATPRARRGEQADIPNSGGILTCHFGDCEHPSMPKRTCDTDLMVQVRKGELAIPRLARRRQCSGGMSAQRATTDSIGERTRWLCAPVNDINAGWAACIRAKFSVQILVMRYSPGFATTTTTQAELCKQ